MDGRLPLPAVANYKRPAEVTEIAQLLGDQDFVDNRIEPLAKYAASLQAMGDVLLLHKLQIIVTTYAAIIEKTGTRNQQQTSFWIRCQDLSLEYYHVTYVIFHIQCSLPIFLLPRHYHLHTSVTLWLALRSVLTMDTLAEDIAQSTIKARDGLAEKRDLSHSR